MKPKVLEDTMRASSNVSIGNIPKFGNSTGTELADSNLAALDLEKCVEYIETLIIHLNDPSIHITDAERISWNKRESIVEHTLNVEIHVSKEDRERWNEKETPEGAQAKVDRVMESLNSHIYNDLCHVTTYEKNKLKGIYSKEEIDNLLSSLENKIAWKESVDTFADLYRVYPDPYDGWTVNVLDTDLTYRYDGDDWVCISANVIPVATPTVDGKMSHNDKLKLDNIEEGANNYRHPEDSFTRHVTDNQIAIWTAKADNNLATELISGLMSLDDKKKLNGIEEGANNYKHPGTHSARMIEQTDDLQFVTLAEKEEWNAKAKSSLATWNIDGLLSSSDKKKLDSVSENANFYIHPTFHNANIIQENDDKQFVSANQKHNWDNKFGRGDFIRGSGVFNGTAGARIIHDLNDSETRYSVIITVTSCNTPNKLGIVWVEKRFSDIFIYSSGGDVADTFDYIIIKE